MYYVNPVTWWLRGVLSSILPSVKHIECADSEITYFNAPPGQTCQDYAGDSILQGYLTNGSATSICGYCPYKDGVEYMHTLNVHDDDKWKCFGIFLAFVIINWALIYFFIYTVRIRGWSFGMGFVFSLFGTVISSVKKAVTSPFSSKKADTA
jgi:ABC-type multidrug transport system permease subunit